MSATWVRYFDENYNACYLYNETSGESLWEDDCNTEGMHIVDGSEQDRPQNGVTASYPTITNRTHNDIASDDEEAFIKKKKPKRFRSKDYSRETLPLTEAQKTEFDLLCYTRFLFINAVLFEAPICVIEGIIRIVLLGVACLTKVVFYCLFRSTYQHQIVPTLGIYTREILLTTAATVTFIIPFCILFVYREYSYENDWALRPLPTLLGSVDIRRFATISYGGGALAVNSGVHGYPNTTSTNSSKSKGAAATNKVVYKIGQGQDTWSGSVICVPREIIRDIKSFMSGADNNVESLSIAL